MRAPFSSSADCGCRSNRSDRGGEPRLRSPRPAPLVIEAESALAAAAARIQESSETITRQPALRPPRWTVQYRVRLSPASGTVLSAGGRLLLKQWIDLSDVFA